MYKHEQTDEKSLLTFPKNRIVGLDWLRGLCALSIMLYHLLGSTTLNKFNVLNKLGLYGVSIFFILSGLSMAIVYHHFIKDFKSSIVFFIRRLFRIIPLYFIVCVLNVIPILILTGSFDGYEFLINITTLFGFIDRHNYIAMGAWSIGNEMVYYLFTPFIIFAFNYKKIAGNILYVLTVMIGMYFAFNGLNSNISLPDQWITYIHPFNNFFLFVTGIFMYYNLHNIKISQKIIIPLLLMSGFIFALLPFGDFISIATNWQRVAFCTISTFIVFLFYKIEIQNVSILGVVLEKLGIATYGVYLLHPIVRQYISYLIDSQRIIISTSIILTIIISLLSYYYFEIKLMNYGKRLTNKMIKSKYGSFI